MDEILGADLPVAYIPDHAERLNRRMLSQDREQPRLKALMMALGDGAQLLEDTAFDVLVGTRLELATGVNLDRWGELVGELRLGLTDGDYRRFIRARVLVNVCNGTPDELVTLYKLVMDTDRVQYVRPGAPAFFSLQAVRSSWLSEALRRRVRRLMGAAKPAGVAMELIEAIGDPFGFDATMLPVSGFNVGAFAREV